jgi:transposase InsO family protein
VRDQERGRGSPNSLHALEVECIGKDKPHTVKHYKGERCCLCGPAFYLAVVLDAFNRGIVGWSMATTCTQHSRTARGGRVQKKDPKRPKGPVAYSNGITLARQRNLAVLLHNVSCPWLQDRIAVIPDQLLEVGDAICRLDLLRTGPGPNAAAQIQ